MVECRVPVDQLGIFFAQRAKQNCFSRHRKKNCSSSSRHGSQPPTAGNFQPTVCDPSLIARKEKDIEGVKDLLMMMYRQVGKY